MDLKQIEPLGYEEQWMKKTLFARKSRFIVNVDWTVVVFVLSIIAIGLATFESLK